jgi:golgi-specific brefeldin A-resistance guanine nucleotide exchange factor 1
MQCANYLKLFGYLEKPSKLLESRKRLPPSILLLDLVQLFAWDITFLYLTFWCLRLAEIKSEDAVYVLAYSVIMLNTDLHNPQIRVRRT